MKSKFGPKQFGIIVSAFSIVAFAVLAIVSLQIADQGYSTCPMLEQGTCTIIGHIPLWSYLGFGALIVLAISGAYMFVRIRGEEKVSIQTTAEVKQAIKKLSGDDKAVFDAIAAEGTIFQSDLIRKLGFSKVKTSRILDRLEMRNLVERRRRGMANVVVLKTR